MFITKMSLPRRTFLRGMGATVALPLLEAMVPALTATAQTAANPVRRFGAVYIPHGKIMDQWTPAADGRGLRLHADPETARAVPRSADAWSAASIGPEDPATGGHATAPAMWLTGASPRRPKGWTSATSATIDQIIAKKIGQTTPFPSLELATEDFTGFIGACDAGLQLHLHEHDLVGGADDAAADGDQPARRVRTAVRRHRHRSSSGWRGCARGRSILDSVVGVRRAAAAGARRAAIGRAERVPRERARDRAPDRAGRTATRQRDLAVPAAPIGVPDAFEEHVALMFDLMAVAYQADLTRVFTFMMARDVSNRTYPEIGVDRTAPRACRTTRTKRTRSRASPRSTPTTSALFAKFLDQLKATPDGDGSLLDHSVILYGSGMGNANVHSHVALPYLVAGTGAGAIRGGRHIRAQNHEPSGNLLLSVIDKFGITQDRVGLSTGRVDL